MIFNLMIRCEELDGTDRPPIHPEPEKSVHIVCGSAACPATDSRRGGTDSEKAFSDFQNSFFFEVVTTKSLR